MVWASDEWSVKFQQNCGITLYSNTLKDCDKLI